MPYLNNGIPKKALVSYFRNTRKWIPDATVIHIDDSDVIKSYRHKFENLGIVRDISKNNNYKNVYDKE
jgi:hypothetical protein